MPTNERLETLISNDGFLLHNDQPVTCPKCGARTNMESVSEQVTIATNVHFHTCLGCQHEFVSCDDDDAYVRHLDRKRAWAKIRANSTYIPHVSRFTPLFNPEGTLPVPKPDTDMLWLANEYLPRLDLLKQIISAKLRVIARTHTENAWRYAAQMYYELYPYRGPIPTDPAILFDEVNWVQRLFFGLRFGFSLQEGENLGNAPSIEVINAMIAREQLDMPEERAAKIMKQPCLFGYTVKFAIPNGEYPVSKEGKRLLTRDRLPRQKQQRGKYLYRHKGKALRHWAH